MMGSINEGDILLDVTLGKTRRIVVVIYGLVEDCKFGAIILVCDVVV